MRYCTLLVLTWIACSVSWGQEARLMIPEGHTKELTTAVFSPDGKRVITASKDFTAKVWEATSGRILLNLKGHVSIVNLALFSPDGSKIATSSLDGSTKIWDAYNGDLLRDLRYETMNNAQAPVGAQIFSPDGSKIITTNYGKAIIWDVQSGKSLQVLTGHERSINLAFFSPDGNNVLTTSDDLTAKYWDVQSGKLLITFTIDTKKPYYTACITDAVFSIDKKTLYTSTKDNTIFIWDVSTGKIIRRLDGHTGQVLSVELSPDGKKILTASRDRSARLWDAASGAPLAVLTGHQYTVQTAFFSPDGDRIVTASDDRTAKVWDGESGKLLFNLVGHKFVVGSAVFSPDGKYIVTGSWDNTGIVWNAETGSTVAHLQTSVSPNFDINLDRTGTRLITAHGDGMVREWDVASGRLINSIRVDTGSVQLATYGTNYNTIYTTSSYRNVNSWDIVTGKQIRKIKRYEYDRPQKIEICPDGRTLLIARMLGNTAEIWDTAGIDPMYNVKGHSSHVLDASFSPDGTQFVTASQDNTAKIWNASTGNLISTLKGHSNSVNSASYSPSGDRIVTTSLDRTIKIWDVVSGQERISIKAPNPTGSSFNSVGMTRAVFSPDGKTIVYTSESKIVQLWDAANGALIRELAGHTSDVYKAIFNQDGSKIFTASADNTCKVWDVITGEMLYTFFALDSMDYLLIDRFSRYDGTEQARKLLYFTCGSELVGLDQVKDQLWVPGLAERINQGDRITTPTLEQLGICGRAAIIEEISQASNEPMFKITPRGGELGETAVLVNGIEVQRLAPDSLEKTSNGYTLSLRDTTLEKYRVAGQQNTVSIKTYTKDNVLFTRGLKVEEKETQKKQALSPNLFAVLVGVSDYKGTGLDLKYAAKDAKDLSRALGLTARKLLNTEGKEHVFVYDLTTSDPLSQFPFKQNIKKTLEEIGSKASPQDILVIFFAGHGVVEGEKKQFHFLTANASDLTADAAIKEVGISTEELAEWMRPEHIRAQKRILILDACNSGQAINDMVRMGGTGQSDLAARGDEQTKFIKAIDKLNERSGLFVLSAAASNQSAYELGRYSQGLLTYALLRSIKMQSEILEEGRYLDLSRWFQSAEKIVSTLARESGARQQPQLISNTNFSVGVVDEEVRSKIVLPQEKPLFTGVYLQNADENIASDDLGINEHLNDILQDISVRGGDAPIVYSPGIRSVDAWSMSGRYEVTGKKVLAKVNLKQGKNPSIRKFEVIGNTDDLIGLAKAIAAQAISLVKP